MHTDKVKRFYETLTVESIGRLPELYTDSAFFKDPFNEVVGTAAIQRIFTHMFTQVGSPRFVVTGQVADAAGAFLIWEFHFTTQSWGRENNRVIRGTSHLQFDAQGKVSYHRDYWDTAEELYQHIPLLGSIMHFLQRRLRA